MTQELKLPELGENIDTAVVGAILVAAGDLIRKDQPVIEVETDKATAEVPSTVEGVVREIRVKTGAEIKVGQVILVVDDDGGAAGEAVPRKKAATEKSPGREATPAAAPPEEKREAEKRQTTEVERAAGPEPAAPRETPAPPPAETSTPAPPGPERVVGPAEEAMIPAAPAVRRLARELGVGISEVRGSEPGGRISLEDVKEHARLQIASGGRSGATPGAARAPELPDFRRWGEIRREPMSGIRRKTAENLSVAWAQIPHVTQFDEADVTDVESLRKEMAPQAEAIGGKVTMTAVVLKVAASALKIFPRFNASLDPARQEIIYKQSVHIGVAVDTPQGLLVPVVRDADRKNILQIAADLGELSKKAREKKLTLDEMRGGGFTVTNLGGLGTTHFSPIVNWPEVAILGVGRATTRAVFREDTFVPRLILPLSISYDHRIIDGAEAARFLRWMVEALEEPFKLALEG